MLVDKLGAEVFENHDGDASKRNVEDGKFDKRSASDTLLKLISREAEGSRRKPLTAKAFCLVLQSSCISDRGSKRGCEGNLIPVCTHHRNGAIG